MLHDANALAQRIRRLRFKAGSLDLDFPEMKIRLDEQGRVLRIEKVENDVSHQLIEEFMLLANEAVAGPADGPESCRRSTACTSRRTNGGCRNIARKCSATTFPAAI